MCCESNLPLLSEQGPGGACMRGTRISSLLLVTILGTMTFVPTIIIAQNKPEPRYKLIDLGTFGGPNSSVGGQTVVVSKMRKVPGGADTSIPDPYAPQCFNPRCFVEHAFFWNRGTLTDLGTLPGGDSSFGYAINERDLVVGWSQNGVIDPLTGVPEYVPTAWRKGKVVEIGTFGGAFGQASALNDEGFVVGAAENATPDPFGLAGIFGIDGTTELHAFGWKSDSGIFDLGTLGGPGAVPLSINRYGQIAGASFTSSTPGPTGIPPLDPFLWQNGVMIDLGTLGGTFGVAAKVTSHGQVVGDSNLEGDSTQHGFSWKEGLLADIGTLGGDFSTAKWVNEFGEAVGAASIVKGQFFPIRAFAWKNGKMKDLGTVEGDLCSIAWSINEAAQIVGNSAPECNFSAGGERAFLWERGHIFDLNAFVPADSDLYLFETDFINDRGDITGPALLPNGDVHQYLLLRCFEDTKDCRVGARHGPPRTRNSSVVANNARMDVTALGKEYIRRNGSRTHFKKRE
jgi:probable HAF family extracellular repeat protein